MGKFEVLRGIHSEGVDEKDKPIEFHVGDVVNSKTDLLKHNKPGSEKFRRVPDETAAKNDSSKKSQKAGSNEKVATSK